MRVRSGYDSEGHPLWRELGPANGAAGPYRPHGSIVIGESERARDNAAQKRYTAKRNEDARLRYQAKRNEDQRRYRARKKEKAA